MCVRGMPVFLELRARADPPNFTKRIMLLNRRWFKPRGYKHFDQPVNCDFIDKSMDAKFVSTHSFSPLIYYTKKTKSYKKRLCKTRIKERPIMYASHKDACIFTYYSCLLNQALDEFYAKNDLNNSVIAYRSLEKANYHFSEEAYKFAKLHEPVKILAFDVSSFFDKLDHKLLKEKLKHILKVRSLSKDWYKVYSNLTKYHFIKLEDIQKIPKFKKRLKNKTASMIAPIADIKAANIRFYSNPNPGEGIPQGTPISASLSNAYMIEFDQKAKLFCDSIGAFYRRYSDDILIICSPTHAEVAKSKIKKLINKEKLKINEDKTMISDFSSTALEKIDVQPAQYLGFTLDPSGTSIRPSSMSRQWRKMRRAIGKTRRAAEIAITEGKADRVYTKSLRKRFSPLQHRNFSSYARKSATVFGGSKQIKRQIYRLERAFEEEILKMKNDLNKL